MPEERYCCEHSAQCSVHQIPFDGGYVACTCAVGAGSVRHERVTAQPAAQPASVQELSRTALGALIALEAGQNDLAARLLSDVLVQSGRATDAPPPEDPETLK